MRRRRGGGVGVKGRPRAQTFWVCSYSGPGPDWPIGRSSSVPARPLPAPAQPVRAASFGPGVGLPRHAGAASLADGAAAGAAGAMGCGAAVTRRHGAG